MPRTTRRADRVAEAIREEVASYLATGVKDPRITGLVTVTGVELTADLRYARVYVSLLGGPEDPTQVLEGLNDVGRRIKGQIGRALHLRLAPELQFVHDTTVAHASRIESLLAQLRQNPESTEPPSSPDDDRRDD